MQSKIEICNYKFVFFFNSQSSDDEHKASMWRMLDKIHILRSKFEYLFTKRCELDTISENT